ncbi:hypothetical protein ACFL57_02005 [Candidatus Margulisiibacteriota bacterium]
MQEKKMRAVNKIRRQEMQDDQDLDQLMPDYYKKRSVNGFKPDLLKEDELKDAFEKAIEAKNPEDLPTQKFGESTFCKNIYQVSDDDKLIFDCYNLWGDIENLWNVPVLLIKASDKKTLKSMKKQMTDKQLMYLMRFEELVYGVANKYVSLSCSAAYMISFETICRLLTLGRQYDWADPSQLMLFNYEFAALKSVASLKL